MLQTKIKTVEDAFAYLGLDNTALPQVDLLPENARKAVVDYYKLNVVREALNKEANEGKDWQPNWDDFNELKYYPWFRMGVRSGFAFRAYAYGYPGSAVGSRLCFISSEVAEYAGKQFIELYRSTFLLTNNA